MEKVKTEIPVGRVAMLIFLATAGCSSLGSSNRNSDSGFISSVTTGVTDAGNKVSDFVENTLTPTGLYLHNDSYQQKADSALADFNKIDLTSKFDEQFKTVTSYDSEEDQAVAALTVATRNWQLQQFIEMPAWQQSCFDDENHHVPCSGTAGLRYRISQDLLRLTGSPHLNNAQRKGVRDALFLKPDQEQALETDREQLAADLRAFAAVGSHAPTSSCSAAAPKLASMPQMACHGDPVCLWQNVQYDCAEIARLSRAQRLIDASVGFQGEISELFRLRNEAIDAQAKDVKQANDLTALIDKITQPSASPDQSGGGSIDPASVVAEIQDKLAKNEFSAVAKYFGFASVATHLQSLLSNQLTQNLPQSKSGTQKTAPQSTVNSSQVQALINLATSAQTLANDYADKQPHERVNALLLATAAARHQVDLAKLDAEYQADVITIYNAEIDARLRQTYRLDQANLALAAAAPMQSDFASPTPASQPRFDALAAWVASQDEGEIPYQVLAAKEVQLLRAKSVKQGQLSAQGYENVIQPVLAELDAYAKGGVTKEAIVQALGFVGVITSISAK